MKKNHFLGLSQEGFHRIAYTEWGMTGNPNIPIICVHGLSRNGRDFDELANYLAQRHHHVYCPDLVGRGDSDWFKNSSHYTYDQYLNDMNALMMRTQAEQIDWIGTSMGGLLGLFLASLPQTPIRRLVLNDIGPQIPAAAIRRILKYTSSKTNFTSHDEAKKYFKIVYANFGITTEEQWDNFTENSLHEVAANIFLFKCDPNIRMSRSKNHIPLKYLIHPLKALEGILFDVDLWEIWHKIKCPVLVFHGEKSDVLLPDIINKMKNTHQFTEVHLIPNTGHAPALLDGMQHDIIYNWLNQKIQL